MIKKTFTFIVSTDHVGEQWRLDRQPVVVNEDQYGDDAPVYWCSIPGFGCSKHYPSPRAAIEGMVGDHAATITHLEEVVDEEADADESEDRRELSTADHFMTFIFAGNATVTLRSKKTGTRYTYRIRQKGNDDDGKTPFFVSLLRGPSNEDDFTYIGFIPAAAKTDERERKLVAGKKGKPSFPSFKALDWALRTMTKNNAVPGDLEVWHEGRCCRCNRKLTVPESIASGIGPECATKM